MGPISKSQGWVYFRWIALALGAGLFLWLIWISDLTAVWNLLRSLRWRFFWVLVFYVVIFGLDTLGWKYALRVGAGGGVSWLRLFRARLAGEAINYVTPTAWIGGEPVKAALLAERYGISMADGMASVVVAKTTFAVSMLLFILVGLGVTLATQSTSVELIRWAGWALPVLAILLGLFLMVQFLRPFGWAASFLARVVPGWSGRVLSGARGWDEAVVSFYRRSPGLVAWSLAFHFLGWVAGALEVAIILWFLGIPVSLSTAFSIEALWVLFRSGAFLIPASLGASEGIGLVVCGALGIHAAPGLALALVRRARELAWVGLGLAEFARVR